jgi:Leucine-rich repeat (LRR) protein
VESSLELLDLERNRLSNISSAFSQLTGLRYLYLSNNNISEVPDNAFQSFSESLQAVSLSGNQIATFPQTALLSCSKLSHLNLGKTHCSTVL